METSQPAQADEKADADSPTSQDLEWKPSSGRGTATALNNLKRMERMKATWSLLRGSIGPGGRDGPSAK